MVNWQQMEHKYYMHTFERIPLVLVRGQGAKVWDEKGREYLDFVAGLAVDSLGHCHPVVADTVARQANTLIQTSNLFYTIPQLQLAELLVENSCLDQVFFCNSGAEANEGAVKLARRYGKHKLANAYEIITAFNSFHGRTLAMTAATGQKKFQDPYQPLPIGFSNVDYNDIEAIKKATSEKTCAVLLEPLEAEGGVNIPSSTYLKEVSNWCDQNNILLILDEIQTGIARTGTLFAYEQYDIEPDIITLAKGLGGGLPIGAFLAKEKASVFMPGEHGSTFGGNVLTCAAAYTTLKFIIENNIIEHVKNISDYLFKNLEKLKEEFSYVTDVRGRGLLVALEFSNDIAQQILSGCLNKGLLVNKLKPNTLRFIPPLIIGESDVDEAIRILREVLAQDNP